RSGKDATRELPPGRWNSDLFDADPEASGRFYVRRGGFLDAVDQFDPSFFGVSPREAAGLDPQQRLLLEVGWEAPEPAGLAAASLLESPTGVFVGISHSEYHHYLLLASGDPHLIDAHLATGLSPSVAAGRLSYVFGFRGPSLTVDTACSSSL